MGKRQEVVQFRFDLTAEDYRCLRLIAAADDRPMSAWLRRQIRSEAARLGIARPAAPRVVAS